MFLEHACLHHLYFRPGFTDWQKWKKKTNSDTKKEGRKKEVKNKRKYKSIWERKLTARDMYDLLLFCWNEI